MVTLHVEMWEKAGHQTISLGTWRWPVVPTKGDAIVLHGNSCEVRNVYHHLEGRHTTVKLYVNYRVGLEKWAEERLLRPDEPSELTDPLDEWEREIRENEGGTG